MGDAPGPSGRQPTRDDEGRADGPGDAGADGAGSGDPETGRGGTAAGDAEEPSAPASFREAVEQRYDFDRFSPADMAEMTVEEWEAAFDPDAWITGRELLDRVEADLRSRVARREVFAVVERAAVDGADRVLAYTDVGYATVAPDGSVEGEGAILADVEPVVALCSMADYDVPAPPEDGGLPHPEEVGEGAGSLGDRLLLAVAGVQVLAGLALLVVPAVVDLDPGGPGGGGLLTTVAGLGFLFIGIVIGVLVANARLSGRFRAEEYRKRLRAAGVGSDERPAFLPGERLGIEAGQGDDATGGGGGADRGGEGGEARDGGSPNRAGSGVPRGEADAAEGPAGPAGEGG